MTIPLPDQLEEHRSMAFHVLNKLYQSVQWTEEFGDGTLFVFRHKYSDKFISINGQRVEFNE